MTNLQFAEWRKRHFRSRLAASAYLELDRDTITALETGLTRKGEAYPVRRHIELACLYLDGAGRKPPSKAA